MAVTARFQADFSSFTTAVDKAEVQLADFAKGANKAEAALNRMVDQFSGRKAVQEAALLERAVKEVGGVANLTEKELQNLGAKATEAIEKMKKLGIDVPPGLQHISDAAKSANSGFGSMLGTVGKLAGAIGIGFSVGAVINFGKSILESADSLTKLKDKTGIGVVALQRLQAIGDDSGNSIEQIATAVNKFQNALISGQASTALDRIGLSAFTLKQLKPDEQFYELAKAVQAVKDPAEQTRLAIELFGKSGAEILPSLKSAMKGVGDTTVGMSEEAVAALDELGDALTRLKRGAIGFAGEVAAAVLTAGKAMKEGNVDAQEATAKTLELMKEISNPTLPGPPGGRGGKSPLPFLDAKSIEDALEPIDAVMTRLKKTSEQADKTRDALAKMAQFKGIKNLAADFSALGQSANALPAIAQNFDDLIRTGVSITNLGQDFSELSKHSRTVEVGIRNLGQDFSGLGPQTKVAAASLKQVNSTLGSMADLFIKLGQASGGTMGELLGGIGQLVVVLDAQKRASKDGATAADKWAVAIAGAAAAVQTFNAQTAKAGAISGATAGAAFGPYGALIGGLAGLVIGHHNAQKAAKEQAQEVEKLRLSYAQTLGRSGVGGTLDDLRAKAKSVGLEIQTMLTTKNAETFRYEMERLKKALQFQDDALQQLDDTLKKYNISIGEAGAAAATRLLGEEAKGLYTDFKVLEAGGVDAAVAITGMQDALSQLVRDSISSGIALPKQFEGIIKQMRALGLLTDDVGDKFTDAELDGLEFGGTLTDGINDLTDAIKALTDAIGRGLGNAIKNLPALPGVTDGAGGGLGRNPGGGAEPVLPEGVIAGLAASRGGVTVQTAINLDGREVAKVVSFHQAHGQRDNVKARAA